MNPYSATSCQQCARLAQTEAHHRSYVSHLSHEIRNPLTFIYSSLQMLEKECPSVTESGLWTQIKEDMRFTIRLLQDVSTLNKDRQINRKPVVAADLLSGIAASCASLMAEKQIRLQTDFRNAGNTILQADCLRLQEALTNLLINAADALETVPGNRRIRFSADCADGQLRIHVRDNGPGIPEAYLETLFDPFVTHKKNGTGLGLAIVKSIVSAHNGSISVCTNTQAPETFCDFCLQLPLG